MPLLFNILMFWSLTFGLFLIIMVEDQQRESKERWTLFFGGLSCLVFAKMIQPRSQIRDFLISFVIPTAFGDWPLLLFVCPLLIIIDIIGFKLIEDGDVLRSFFYFSFKWLFIFYLITLSVLFFNLYKRNYVSFAEIETVLLQNADNLFQLKLNASRSLHIIQCFEKFARLNNYTLQYNHSIVNSFSYEWELVNYLKNCLHLQIKVPIVKPTNSWWWWIW